MKRSISLRAKTIVFTIALAFVPLLLLAVALLGISYNAKRADVLEQQRAMAAQLASRVGSTLSEMQRALDMIGWTSNWQALDASSRSLLIDNLYKYRMLASVQGGFGEYDEVALFDSDAQPVAGHTTIRMEPLASLAEEVRATAFDVVMRGEAYHGLVYISQATFPTLDIAVPARDLPGRITGVLWGAINLDQALWPVIAAPGVPTETLVYLLDEQGYLVLRNDDHTVKREEPLSTLAPFQAVSRGSAQGLQTYQGLQGLQVVGAWQPVEGLGWTLVIETPTQLAFADVRRLLTPAALLSLITIAAAVVAGVLVSGSLTGPIEALRRGAEIVGAGNLSHVIDVRGRDEIGSLAQTFNRMAANLRNSQAELERWGHDLEDRIEERTRALAEASERMRRRAVQLQTSAEVARAVASERDLGQLLSLVTRLISDRFGWYHVGIFLADEQGEYAVLEAANSEGGQRMLARSHKLKIGEVGIVGSVTRSGESLIALDVGASPHYFDTPELRGTRSEMALPLKVGERIIGALDVQSKEAAAYDDEDATAMSILADQVAIAIETARLFEQTQRALEEVRALHRRYVQREWARRTARKRDLAFEYRRRGTPSLVDASLPEIEMALARGEIVTVADYATLLEELDADLDVLGKGTESVENLPERHLPKAALAAPIKVRDQVIGVLDLQETDGTRQWTDDDVALVRAIGDQVGQALETARLFEETSRRAEQMATLNRIGLNLVSGLELERVLQSLYEQCRQVLATDAFYVALTSDGGQQVEFPFSTGLGSPIHVEPLDMARGSAEYRFRAGGLAARVIRSGQLLHVPDTQAVPEQAVHEGESGSLPQGLWGGDWPNRSYLGVPLTARGQVIGALSIESREPRAYGEEDVELLATIATQASIAIENARAYERLMETADELRELDRLKMQFLANMSHELRTPLNSIIGFARVILKGIDGPLTELQATDLTSIYNSGQHLLGLINSILDMSKIEAGKMDLAFEEVDLTAVINGAMSVANALVKDRPIQLLSVVPDDLPAVWADEQRVRQVLLNLLSNAAKFTEEGQIALQAKAGPDLVTISVSDTGIGIDPKAQKRIFVAFQQVDGSTTRRVEGTGLGLAISRNFVELHGGKIWVESQVGKGSTFYFTLPIYRALAAAEGAEREFRLEPW
jgi:signal transduction histidine kinase/HAMP domain-containing protein